MTDEGWTNFVCSWQEWCALKINAVWCIAFVMGDWFGLLRKFLFFLNRINYFMYFWFHWPTYCLNQILLEFDQYLVVYIFSALSTAAYTSTDKCYSSMYFSMANIISPKYTQHLKGMILPTIQNHVGICTRIALLIVTKSIQGWQPSFNSLMPLHKSMLFLFLPFVQIL